MNAFQDPEIGKSVVAAGLQTNYLEEGEGFPAILLHGSGPGVTSYANWRFTLPVLAGKFRAIAPDAAGFGYTERGADADYTLDFWVGHIVGFMDALSIEKAHFVGNSFGGALTLAIAARYPERVDRLVLMGAAGVRFELTDALDVVWGYEPSVDNMRRIMDRFAYNQALINEDLIEARYRASIRPGYHESYSRMFPAPRQRHVERLATPDEAVRALPHRALIVHGRDDQVIPLSNSLHMHDLIERSELHVFGQCGHWTQIEKKDRFNRLVLDFLLAEPA
ncbi:alpha/beta fold hydrolase [Bradyrhizobium manausense]|jgi:2-hydroxymuconate-semialdehyde hydrolase|uniref:alpha/beta fold hydrolase n=1 Tax=Bradyrhizobium manausense TaxID=989370 RepID=UPI001BAACF8B|nr:alpha/beta fold hydrolase [Bradyrhizobium manausense]MBR1087709.1 alpha/beta fold hydrolase [Bradyrhizobium manausense]